MTNFYEQLLRGTMPELVLTVTAFAVLGVDLFHEKGGRLGRWRLSGVLALLGIAVAVLLLPGLRGWSGGLGDVWVLDGAALLVKGAIFILLAGVVWLSLLWRDAVHVGEHYLLLLLAGVGLSVMVSSANLVVLFVGLELASLSGYLLVGLGPLGGRSGAALRYFVFGSTAAAITLYGLSLIYGATGSVSLAEIGVRLVTAENRGLVIAGIAMSMAGILFKVAVVPFHWWVPDVYRVAPAPAGALIASAFKVAGFLLLGRLAWLGFGVGSNHWVGVSGQSVLAAVAVASMVVGNLGALAQVELRRLVGFSAVGHAGYLLLGVVGGGEAGLGSVVYYAVTYGLTSLGLFGMVLWLERENGHSRIDSLRGSGRRHPWAAACMAVLVLSLASIPPLPGFFGKFYLFVAVLQGGQELGQGVGLVAVAVLMSAVSLYYYLRILKVALVEEWEGGPAGGGSGWFLGWLGAVTGLVLLAGLFPGLILSMF